MSKTLCFSFLFFLIQASHSLEVPKLANQEELQQYLRAHPGFYNLKNPPFVLDHQCDFIASDGSYYDLHLIRSHHRGQRNFAKDENGMEYYWNLCETINEGIQLFSFEQKHLL